jgi:hypothetical protein
MRFYLVFSPNHNFLEISCHNVVFIKIDNVQMLIDNNPLREVDNLIMVKDDL